MADISIRDGFSLWRKEWSHTPGSTTAHDNKTVGSRRSPHTAQPAETAKLKSPSREELVTRRRRKEPIGECDPLSGPIRCRGDVSTDGIPISPPVFVYGRPAEEGRMDLFVGIHKPGGTIGIRATCGINRECRRLHHRQQDRQQHRDGERIKKAHGTLLRLCRSPHGTAN